MMSLVVFLKVKYLNGIYLFNIYIYLYLFFYLSTLSCFFLQSDVKDGVVQLFFLSPECLQESGWLCLIQGMQNVVCVAFDEVHCLSSWYVKSTNK